MSRFGRRLVLVLLVGVIVYAAAVIVTGYRSIEESLDRFRWVAFAAALGLSSLNYALRFLKWQFYLARLSIRNIPVFESLLIFLSGFVLTVTPGKLGEVFKSAVLRQTHGVAAARSAPIVVAERLTDVIAVILLIACGSAGFAGGLFWAAAGSAAVLAGLVVILWDRPAVAFIGALEKRPAVARFAPKVAEAHKNLRQLATPAALLWPIFLSVIGWGCEGIALYVLLLGLGTPAPLPLAVFFYSTASLAGALIPVPGGLGVVEAMIQEQLVRLGGVPAGAATSSMILIRFATLWWAVLVGFSALALLRARHPALRSWP